ncbi:hypothetical protein MY4824_008348 [Beauveria thailandica]
MAMAGKEPGDTSSRKLHPFFAKGSAFPGSERASSSTPTINDRHESKRVKTNEYAPPHQPEYTDSGRMYYTQPLQEADISTQQLQQPQPTIRPINAPPHSNVLVPGHSVPETPAPLINSEPYTTPSCSTSCASHAQADLPVACGEAPAHHTSTSQASESRPPINQTPTLELQKRAPPKKVLKFNMRTGTLGSPPKLKPQRRSSRLVSIKYGQDAEARKRIGDRISRILSGQLLVKKLAPDSPQPKPEKMPTDDPHQKPSKTHPFFTKEKPVEPKPISEKKRNTIFMSTPVSPRKPCNSFTSGKGPSFGIKPIGTKVPGAKYPLWPPHGFSHVRGTEPLRLTCTNGPSNRPNKKSKGQSVSTNSHESVLWLQGRQLNIQQVKRSLPKDDSLFPPPPSELRLPTRHFESGYKLAKRIRSELETSIASLSLSERDLDEDDLARVPSKPAHPIIERHWQSLAKGLSAFDRSTCESMSWVSKYAPTSAAEVLQSGKEVTLLKQWLEMLRVQGVETAGDGSAKTKSEAKKKKRKSKLDDFVIDSEDESGEMNELSDLEDQLFKAKQRLRPSVVRSLDLKGKDPSKLANTILISGPHGSGKSASVYAVAKELGFEVFEINSSTRRSGKDILERVGDMTRNHLVQHHRSETADSAGAIESDISSGKQGTMTSFFKPKTAAEKKKKKKSHMDRSRAKADTASKSSSSKSHKQSLILLEEVDILFEEDKQFWASLQSLMSQSKRPFILTCNDESAVPVSILNLHGIFRFLPPPEPVAVDTCLLIAANEGHALKRNAVRSLYRCRDHDLRATITDLQFWCQIGVGDRRGGHDWFYLRWPKGIDVDKQGHVVRVISEDTYQTGMGWLSRDSIVSAPTTQAMEREAAAQAWQFWHRDLSDSHCTKDLVRLGAATSTKTTSRQQRLKTLEAYTQYYDALSCADLCAAGALGVELTEMLDPTLPEMPVAMREDFTIAQALLEANIFQPYSCSRVEISSAISSLALGNLKTAATRLVSSPSIDENEAYGEQKTVDMLEDMHERENRRLTRYDVAVAFDPIAVSPKAMASMSLDPSVFDRTMTMIIEEVAPWIRGIVHYDDQLMQDRQRLNELLDDGSRRKRMRTTRSAYSALEGGERRTTRKERYFGDCLSTEAVMYTAGDSWQQALPLGVKMNEAEDYPASSPMSMDSAEGLR